MEPAATIPPKSEKIPLPRWIAPLATVCVVALVPWIVYLALTLPKHTRARHYDVAWVGYDAAMCIVLAALALAAARRRPSTAHIAAVAATMLVIDAWFDVVTAAGHEQFVYALLSAVTLEIPLALLCAWVAVNAEKVRSRAYRRLWNRAVRTEGAGRRVR